MIDPRRLPYDLRRQVWRAVAFVALLVAVAFLLGFTLGRWVEHGR